MVSHRWLVTEDAQEVIALSVHEQDLFLLPGISLSIGFRARLLRSDRHGCLHLNREPENG
jgi:hypothetical protein